MRMQRVVTMVDGERVIRRVPVPDPEDLAEEDGNPPGSFEVLFTALGGGIPPLAELADPGEPPGTVV